jgi:hypothetical protein
MTTKRVHISHPPQVLDSETTLDFHSKPVVKTNIRHIIKLTTDMPLLAIGECDKPHLYDVHSRYLSVRV